MDVLYQMLCALDFLARKRVIYRDVRPDNILWSNTGSPDAPIYRFILCDFNLCEDMGKSKSRLVGTSVYMAPEAATGQVSLTPKFDVWSLFASMVWVYDAGGFRDQETYLKSPSEIFGILARDSSQIRHTEEMSEMRPEERASAAEMLAKLFDQTNPDTSCSPASRLFLRSRPLRSSARQASPRRPGSAHSRRRGQGLP